MAACTHVLSRGPRKGQACGAVRCRKHDQPVASATTGLVDLPQHLIEIIVELMVARAIAADDARKAMTFFVMLATSCTTMRAAVCEPSVWQPLWRWFGRTAPACRGDADRTCLDRMKLHFDVGCQMCGLPRVRKVTAAFGVRVCKDCLFDNTVSCYRLVNDFFVPRNRFVHLPHTQAEMFRPSNGRRYGGGSFTLDFFWIDDVERELGAPLDEWRRRVGEERLREKKAAIVAALSGGGGRPYDVEFVLEQARDASAPVERLLADAARAWSLSQWEAFLVAESERREWLDVALLRGTATYDHVTKREDVRMSDRDWAMAREDVEAARKLAFVDAVRAEAQRRRLHLETIERLPEIATRLRAMQEFDEATWELAAAHALELKRAAVADVDGIEVDAGFSAWMHSPQKQFYVVFRVAGWERELRVTQARSLGLPDLCASEVGGAGTRADWIEYVCRQKTMYFADRLGARRVMCAMCAMCTTKMRDNDRTFDLQGLASHVQARHKVVFDPDVHVRDRAGLFEKIKANHRGRA